MRRRSVLGGLAAAASAIGLAGCAGAPTGGSDGSDAPSVAEGFAEGGGDADVGDIDVSLEPDRPECEVESAVIEADVGGETREFETAATVPYPDPPGSDRRERVARRGRDRRLRPGVRRGLPHTRCPL